MRTRYFLLLAVVFCGCFNRKDLGESNGSRNKQKMLAGMELTAVHIDLLPRYGHDGEKWDAWAAFAEDPDVFIRLSQFDVVIFQSEVKAECAYNKKLDFTQNLPLTFVTYTQPILLEIFDEDGISSDDNIGYFEFNPIDYQKKSKIVLANSEGTLKLTLDIYWVYKDAY